MSKYTEEILAKKKGAGSLVRSGSFELEIKIKNATKAEFLELLDYANERYPLVKSHTVDYFVERNRFTKENSRYRKTTKTGLFNKDVEASGTVPHNYRISLAFELEEDASLSEVEGLWKNKRDKERYSFTMGGVRLDMTKVETFGPNIVTHEIELELLEEITASSLLLLDQAFDEINAVLMRAKVIMSFNKYTDGRNDQHRVRMDYDAIARVRNLKLRDITSDGLTSGDYTVTVKADGERVLILVNSSGIWMLQALLGRDNVVYLGERPEKLSRVDGIVLDCEYLLTRCEDELFVAFDILSFGGTAAVQKLPLLAETGNSRLKALQKIVVILGSTIPIETKTFARVGTTSETATEAFNMLKSEPRDYEDDGFIITPISGGYLPKTNNIPLEKRILSDFADICKLKPWHLLTMDVVYRNGYFYVTENKGQGLVPFTGTSRTPFTRENIYPGITPHETRVIEVAPERSECGMIRMKFYRNREDKTQPNRLRVAENVWSDLHYPVTPDTVEGRDLKMVRDYHNGIKRYILDQIPRGSVLVDLGSGRLGDMGKWSKLGRILAIEPNGDHIAVARNRLANYPKKDSLNIRMIQGGAEDTTIILQEFEDFIGPSPGVPVYISSMLTLSFLYSSSEVFNGLVDTLRGVARLAGTPIWFIFLTIEGERVKKLFGGVSGLKQLDSAQLRYDAKREELYVHIDGTIVEDQTEYLVNIDRLAQAVTPPDQKAEYQVNDLPDPSKNKLRLPKYSFSETNTLFNSLYVYGQVKVYP